MKVSHLVVSDSATPWTVALQAPLSMEFSRQEYWSGLPFPSPGDLPYSGIEPGSPALEAGNTTALTRRTFVGKVMSLLLNMLSRLVITFLPRSRHHFLSGLQSPTAVILEPPKNKV